MIEAESSAPRSIPLDDRVLSFHEIDPARIAHVGGKGAHLAKLARIEGVHVPAGYCVTTDAFRQVVASVPEFGPSLDRLSRLGRDDRDAIRTHSAQIRSVIERAFVPDDLAAAIIRPLARLGEDAAYAVRSSATAEDLPSASFAGQQDSYLNVVGPAKILEHVRRCWASLFTERAVTYRLRNDFDHRKVHMAVVVQRMVHPESAGVLFTADPATSNRTVTTIEATFGLGEALVSGLVNPDVYRVRDEELIEKAVAAKRVVIRATVEGGTAVHELEPEPASRPALTDLQVLRLARIGRRIEAHLGGPQDIEWCLRDGEFSVVQSRPITTLFPVPDSGDDANRVYVSVGHQQMMTDAMKPLGLSFWQLTTPRTMIEIGSRPFVDVTDILASPAIRDGFLNLAAKSDPLMSNALQTVLDRGDFVAPSSATDVAPPPPVEEVAPIDADPGLVEELIERAQKSVEASASEIRTKSGSALFDFIRDDLQELKRVLFDPQSHRVIMVGMGAAWWLNEQLEAWLGEKNAADTLSQSVPYNVTSQMGLALLDVADVIRPHPDVVAYLRNAPDDDFLDGLTALDGGPQARDAIRAYLDRYGVRCVGEIDITRPRWSERPATLVPAILGHVENFETGAGQRRFDRGVREAQAWEAELLARLRALPDGETKAAETKQAIDRLRAFAGYREYPKYAMISRYFGYKRALLEEAERLVREGVLADAEDAFYLTFEEFHEVVRTGQVDAQLIRSRADQYKLDRTLTPPRVLTSDGEAISGAYRHADAPAGALGGVPVYAGAVEGRARVVLDLAEADLEPGDILVTAYTDPSWSPAFVTIGALVTEVGGLMTHGAVIAREYGLPTVVGVEDATRHIQDGQRIRVDGVNGYVEVLD